MYFLRAQPRTRAQRGQNPSRRPDVRPSNRRSDNRIRVGYKTFEIFDQYIVISRK